MDQASLLAFDEAAQVSFEATYPTSFRVRGSELDIHCAGGAMRITDRSFFPGGRANEFDINFRVRKTRLNNLLPEPGTILEWGGKTIKVMRSANPPTSVAFVLQCGPANQRK